MIMVLEDIEKFMRIVSEEISKTHNENDNSQILTCEPKEQKGKDEVLV